MEAYDETEAVDEDADVGHDVVEMGGGGPAVPEEAEGDEEGGREHHVGAEFGDADVVVAGFAEDVDLGRGGGLLEMDFWVGALVGCIGASAVAENGADEVRRRRWNGMKIAQK